MMLLRWLKCKCGFHEWYWGSVLRDGRSVSGQKCRHCFTEKRDHDTAPGRGHE